MTEVPEVACFCLGGSKDQPLLQQQTSFVAVSSSPSNYNTHKKKKKNPNAPKQPMSAYFVFYIGDNGKEPASKQHYKTCAKGPGMLVWGLVPTL